MTIRSEDQSAEICEMPAIGMVGDMYDNALS